MILRFAFFQADLIRHASNRFTVEFYTQTKMKAKQDAQQRIVQTIVPNERLSSAIKQTLPRELLDGSE